jgi:hypothetical protein
LAKNISPTVIWAKTAKFHFQNAEAKTESIAHYCVLIKKAVNFEEKHGKTAQMLREC